MWGVVWKGYEVKGVDGGGGYQNERIAGKKTVVGKEN